MNLNFNTVYRNFNQFFHNGAIDLRDVDFFDPWGMGLVCLKAIENKIKDSKSLVLPSNEDTLAYLKRMHFDILMGELTYNRFLGSLNVLGVNERDNMNIQEIMHCSRRDEFEARLSSKVRAMFRAFGVNEQDEPKATGLMGELGNNVFDHNAGLWPTDVVGAIIIAQHYPKLKKIDVVVADPGIGFLGSLKAVKPEPPSSDIEAIKLGLAGVTGRIGEKRGNGLRMTQDWTINDFEGVVTIHSGSGLVVINKNGRRERVVDRIAGTLAGLAIMYN